MKFILQNVEKSPEADSEDIISLSRLNWPNTERDRQTDGSCYSTWSTGHAVSM